MNRYGLIGYPLTHSFSKKYFTEKFAAEGIPDSQYDLFELPVIEDFPEILRQTPGLRGLNVTIPHKQAVIPFLDALDEQSAGRIGAVNTIKILSDGRKIGYNTDYYGFRQSLESWLEAQGVATQSLKALVLGNGGAAKAVTTALTDLAIQYRLVSRRATENDFSYEQLDATVLSAYKLIINTSPVGTYPKVDEAPALPYDALTPQHLLYDLVYNPAETLFLQKGKAAGAATHNGLPMLQLQAEKAWEIWQS
ncbi:shikimate dehydrogenase family protein [Tellurirhabdus rosea]|uniref:shikimate dehydrogenase family protein n=1 Tax=Tellurirhabdus rosea TaxID=2674997 RepID=UPI0022556D3F|nr:shikimate dehydrogenase [Tellurirhabdus rosea]